ncbi:histidine kinase [Congregibacter brevis]|uniref:Histidine kinase n=1 Tax=Congregibacter brevis TaxID=3081201 RepID=A0ABZ0IHM5_9GAMM|nr:histidine kinase [Congregibacter sp. IMCC45268]
MQKRPVTLDQSLLNLSGLLAIAVCGWVSLKYFDFWPNLALYSLFAAAFTVQSFSAPLGVKATTARSCVIVMLVLSVAVLFVNRDTVALILSVVLMASTPHHFKARESWVIMAVANLCYVLVFWLTETPLESYLYSALSLLALQAFAITSSLAKQREVLAQEELMRKNSELLAARAVMAGQNKADERLRIAGDLHDSIGHRLTALQLQLEVLAHEVPVDHKAQVETCQLLAKDLLEEVRSIVRRMAEDESNDLVDAIRELEALTPGVEVSVDSPLPELEAPLAQQLVFCIQEAIHNAIRHGHANRVEIRGDEYALRVIDNGRGLANGRAIPGFGLRNINNRLAAFGGHAELLANSDTGCQLQLHLSGNHPA